MSNTIICLAQSHGDKVLLNDTFGRIQTVAGVEAQYHLTGQISPSGPHAWFQPIQYPTGSWAGAMTLHTGEVVEIEGKLYEVSRYGIDAK